MKKIIVTILFLLLTVSAEAFIDVKGVNVTILESDYTNSTLVASDLTGMKSYMVDPNASIGLRCQLAWIGNAETHPRFQFIGPTSPTSMVFKIIDGKNATTDKISMHTAYSDPSAGCTTHACYTGVLFTEIVGVLVNGPNIGRVQLQAISSTNGQAITIYRGSYCAWY